MNHLKPSIRNDLSNPEFFDYWSKLAVSDPKRFEEERKEVVEEVILAAPEARQGNLRLLQGLIDEERALGGTPLESCKRLNRLMMGQCNGEDGLIQNLGVLADAAQKHIRHHLSLGQGTSS